MAVSIAWILSKLRFPLKPELGGTPTSFIDGLIPSYVNGTSITFSPGVAYIPGLGRPLQVDAPIALTGLTLTADRWYYFYLYDNNGTPAIEASTTAPAAPYVGSARIKTGDNTRRFILAMRTAVGTAVFYNFIYQPNNVFRYLQSINVAPWRILTNVSPTTPTLISASAVVPTTSTQMLASFTLVQGSAVYDMYLSHANFTAAIISYVRGSTAGSSTSELLFPLNSSAQFALWLSSTAGSALVDVAGYTNDR